MKKQQPEPVDRVWASLMEKYIQWETIFLFTKENSRGRVDIEEM